MLSGGVCSRVISGPDHQSGSGEKVGANHFEVVTARLSVPSIMEAVSTGFSTTGSWLLYKHRPKCGQLKQVS